MPIQGLRKKLLVVLFVFVSLLCSCFLSQLVVAQRTVVTITGLSMPFQVAVNPNGAYAYVTSGGTGSVWVIDTTTNNVVSKITGGNDPFGMDFTPNGEYLYITNGGSDSVWVVDTATNTVVNTIPVGNGPHGLAIMPNGDYAYVTNFGSHSVTVINTALNKAVGTVGVDSCPQGVAFTPDGKYAYVTNFGHGTVSVIDTATTTLITSLWVESGPIDVKITPDGKYAYVSNSGSESISVIDTKTNTITATIQGFLQPFHIAITSDGTTAYVANGSGDWISIINLSTNEVTGKITVGNGPYGLALTPDNTYAYAVNFYGPTVSVVNLDKITNQDNINMPIKTPPAIVSRFPIPALNSSVNFAANNDYSNAILEDNMWRFTDLCIDNSLPFEHFEVLAQNTDLTVFSCDTVRTLEFQSIRLDYTVDGEGKQVLSFGAFPEEGGRVMWSVKCGDVFLTEDVDWSVSNDNKTITVNNAHGNVRVIRYYFSDSFDKPDLTLIERHSVTIVIGVTLAVILAIAVFVNLKTKKQMEFTIR